jgi:hypothetical protein
MAVAVRESVTAARRAERRGPHAFAGAVLGPGTFADDALLLVRQQRAPQQVG